MSVHEVKGKPIERTHASWIHPTKGYRVGSAPRGTNKRRRPIRALTGDFRGSTEANRRELSGGRWPKMTPDERRRYGRWGHS